MRITRGFPFDEFVFSSPYDDRDIAVTPRFPSPTLVVLSCLTRIMPLIPYIVEEIVNLGTLEQPNYQRVVKVQYYKGKYPSTCKECRAKAKDNPKFQINLARQGSSRCQKHTDRYFKKLRKTHDSEAVV